MGFGASSGGLEAVVQRAVHRDGCIAVTSRYHRLPRRLEDDFGLTDIVLGTGYNGQVQQGFDKATGSKVAIKAFNLRGLPERKKEALEAEVEVFLSMDHPHVVRLVNVYETEEQLELVMECMAGGELFKRVADAKRFTERDAADAAWQMLLALNYIHSHGIVHRDIKLENFLYESQSGSHLKLVDFGFSKIHEDTTTKMSSSVGTLSYVAPEVLLKSYDSKCDMWSFGVVVFVLLLGYMPFSGPEAAQVQQIKLGKYRVKRHLWDNISPQGQDFVQRLLQVSPKRRLSAEQALDHLWIRERESLKASHDPSLDLEIAHALSDFGKASKFRRAAMSAMAWSLTSKERAQVRQAFIEMDRDKTGTIKLHEFKEVIKSRFQLLDDESCVQAFKALDTSNTDEIHYSEFLAAMVSSRIALHDNVLKETFQRFDEDRTGYISKENMKRVLGAEYSDEDIEDLMKEADLAKDGRISYAEWIEYLQSPSVEEHHQEAAMHAIDSMQSKGCQSSRRSTLTIIAGPRPLLEKKGQVFCCMTR